MALLYKGFAVFHKIMVDVCNKKASWDIFTTSSTR